MNHRIIEKSKKTAFFYTLLSLLFYFFCIFVDKIKKK